MATVGNSYLDLVDIYKREDSSRKITPVIEALHSLNPLMQDAYLEECNEGTRHLHTIRTGLPSVVWGQFYKGIAQSKSITQQVHDTTGFLEGRSTVATNLLDTKKNAKQVRMSEAEPFLESIAQEAQRAFFYSDSTVTPEAPKGLAARYSTLVGGGPSDLVIDGGGVGTDNTSIWFVTHGRGKTSIIYPEGTTAGVSREDKGEHLIDDVVNGGQYFAKIEDFKQHFGVAVGDWRYNSRVCNIDASNALAGSVPLYDLMASAYYRMQKRRNNGLKNGGMVSGGQTVIYANRTIIEALDKLARNAGATDNFIRLTVDEVAGKEIMTWRGLPIREVDALINNEARVV
jgi:hypothetical protein